MYDQDRESAYDQARESASDVQSRWEKRGRFRCMIKLGKAYMIKLGKAHLTYNQDRKSAERRRPWKVGPPIMKVDAFPFS